VLSTASGLDSRRGRRRLPRSAGRDSVRPHAHHPRVVPEQLLPAGSMRVSGSVRQGPLRALAQPEDLPSRTSSERHPLAHAQPDNNEFDHRSRDRAEQDPPEDEDGHGDGDATQPRHSLVPDEPFNMRGQHPLNHALTLLRSGVISKTLAQATWLKPVCVAVAEFPAAACPEPATHDLRSAGPQRWVRERRRSSQERVRLDPAGGLASRR
jgi:hypothetical protein